MTDDTDGLSRRRVLRAAGATAAVGATALTTGAAAADPYDDPEYPSEEWFAREQSNWARTREEPLRELNDPGFQKRWVEQSFINNARYRQRNLEETEWDRQWNLCQAYAMQCTGDPYLYPEGEALAAPGDEDLAALERVDEGAADLATGDDLEAALEHLDSEVDPAVAADRVGLVSGRRTGSPGGDLETDVSPAEAAASGAEIETASLPSPRETLESEAGAVPAWDGHPFYDEIGEVRRVAFYDSGLDQDEGGARLSARVWKPKDADPGDDLPGVVITNGSIQASETMYWWFVHSLVEAGYVVLTYDPRGQGRSDNQTPDGTDGGNIESSVFVTNQVDAIDFFRSTPDDTYQHNTEEVARVDHDEVPVVDHNPFHEYLDRDRLGIAGHSLGASGVSVVQGMEWPEMAKGEENPVDVAVAWDNLSEAGDDLAGRTVTPRVPAMGQSADYTVGVPKSSPPNSDAKTTAFENWRDAGVPAYQVNVRGGTHFEWSLVPTFPATSWDSWGNELADHYSLAWLDFWLKEPGESDTGRGAANGGPPAWTDVSGDSDSRGPVVDAEQRLLETDPWQDRWSFYYRSARYFPSADERDAWPAASGNPEGWHVCEDLEDGCE